MIVPAGQVKKIKNKNLNRSYIIFQNANSLITDIIYLLPVEAEPETFVRDGLVITGQGFLEMQNCLGMPTKTEWYGYTVTVGGIDLRVVDL
jgi:hypothetical protein